MCTYSFIADHGYLDLQKYVPVPQTPAIPFPQTWPNDDARIAELERRIKSLEELLAEAKKYDAETGQPDCELDDKKAMLTKLAEQLGVEIHLP